MQPTLILGGGYGGTLAAIRLAQRGFPVTLVDAGTGMVDRIRLHQVAAGEEIEPTPYSRLFRGLPVNFIRGRVLSIDRERRVVKTMAGDLPYERLVYALGSTIGGPEHTLTLAGPGAARTVRERLSAARRVIVVGGGLTGIEVASEIAERYPALAVTLVEANVLRPSHPHLYEWFAAHGVVVREHSRVARIDPSRVVLQSGEEIEGDAVIWCGAFQMSSIARDAGLTVNDQGRIIVNESLQSSDPLIHAIGDAAIYGDLRMACATAMPMGAYVADVLAGATSEPFRFLPGVECISLGRRSGLITIPGGRFLTGRAAAWVKELICRYVATALRLERLGFRYRWPKAA